MTNFKSKINAIVIFSFFIKVLFIIFFHEKSLSDEWLILFQNFQNFKSYSYYVFNSQSIPSSYMPPLYFLFIYFNKFLSFDLINFLYLIYFNQVLISSLTVYLFYYLCKNFFEENFSLIGAMIFSIFPLIIYSNSLISSATLQLFFYLLFFNLFLKFLSNSTNKKDLIYITLVCAATLFLRGEFLIIFLFSMIYLAIFNQKKIYNVLIILLFTAILTSPYLTRNYLNTGKIHLVNVSGYALWKGNNQLAKVEGFHNSLHPNYRNTWPNIPSFENLYRNLDEIKKDKKYEISRDEVFKREALKNIFNEKKKYFYLYIEKILSYFFIDLNSSIKNYYHFSHVAPNLLFSILSLPGAIIGYKKFKGKKIIYLILITGLLVSIISIFFILPRYKISIIGFQILFSLFFFEYLFKKFIKN